MFQSKSAFECEPPVQPPPRVRRSVHFLLVCKHQGGYFGLSQAKKTKGVGWYAWNICSLIEKLYPDCLRWTWRLLQPAHVGGAHPQVSFGTPNANYHTIGIHVSHCVMPENDKMKQNCAVHSWVLFGGDPVRRHKNTIIYPNCVMHSWCCSSPKWGTKQDLKRNDTSSSEFVKWNDVWKQKKGMHFSNAASCVSQS